jgi:diaminohydroxyphosphoribosylaminopyrimidine deaminase/5-amino-6-(5-phosphoribosylamino)uracil reductase
VRDPNPSVAGEGYAYLRHHGVEVSEHVGEAAARLQHAPFFTWIGERRPFVIAKTAVSHDGFVGRAGTPTRLTGPEADRYFQSQRAEVDAIMVGSRTVLVDDPLLTARGAYRYRPLARVLVDWNGQIRPESRVFSTLDAGPVIMFVSGQSAAHGAAWDALRMPYSRGYSLMREAHAVLQSRGDRHLAASAIRDAHEIAHRLERLERKDSL